MVASHALPEGFTDFDMLAFGSALLLEGLLGFFLNAISIISFVFVRDARTPNNFLIFNLAIADISLNVNGLVAAYASFLRSWPYGPEGCQMHAFHGMVSALASIAFLGVIAWDRYHIYCTRQKLPWVTAGTMVFLIWVMAFFWSAMPLKGWGDYDFEPLMTCCTLDYTRGDRNFITYMLSISFFCLLIPAYTMQSSYEAIYNQFKKTRQYKFNTSFPLWTLMFCWGPYVLLCFYASVQNAKLVSPKLRMVLPVLAKTSPVLHSLLYAFGSESYRAGIWQFFTGQKIVVPEIEKRRL